MKPWVIGLGHCSALYDPPRKAVNHLFNKGRSTNVVSHACIILEFGRGRRTADFKVSLAYKSNCKASMGYFVFFCFFFKRK